jgi:hypothetical protein
MNFYEQKINAIKIALGMSLKMAESVLDDNVTKVEAESFEAGSKLFVVSESGEKAPAPEGRHTLQDGTIVTVDSEGTISEVRKPEPKVEVEIEAAAEEDPKEEKLEDETTKEDVKEEMKKMIMQCMEAIEEVAKEVAVVKEEMASYKSKMEKMSKTPGASKLSTFNDEPSTPLSNVEARLEGLKAIKAELSKTKRKF